jgi:hypothetical protein
MSGKIVIEPGRATGRELTGTPFFYGVEAGSVRRKGRL